MKSCVLLNSVKHSFTVTNYAKRVTDNTRAHTELGPFCLLNLYNQNW